MEDPVEHLAKLATFLPTHSISLQRIRIFVHNSELSERLELAGVQALCFLGAPCAARYAQT
eukprot:5125961-Pleurochrysis_carterae.AAC.1